MALKRYFHLQIISFYFSCRVMTILNVHCIVWFRDRKIKRVQWVYQDASEWNFPISLEVRSMLDRKNVECFFSFELNTNRRKISSPAPFLSFFFPLDDPDSCSSIVFFFLFLFFLWCITLLFAPLSSRPTM